MLSHGCGAHAEVCERCAQITYDWIKGEIEKEGAAGGDLAQYSTSQVVSTSAPKALGELRAADGQET